MGKFVWNSLSKAEYITGCITCTCGTHWKPTSSNGMCNSRSVHCIPLQKKAFSSHRRIWLELDCHWTARGCKRSRVFATVCCNKTRMNCGPIIHLQREEQCCSSQTQIFICPILSKLPRRKLLSLNEWAISQQIQVREKTSLIKREQTFPFNYMQLKVKLLQKKDLNGSHQIHLIPYHRAAL